MKSDLTNFTKGGTYGALATRKDTNASSVGLKKHKKQKGLPAFADQQQALEFLREKYPQFFKDEITQEIAAIIIREIGQELGHLSAIQRAGTIAQIIALMYQMGTAAIQSTKPTAGPEPRMGKIFVANYLNQNP
ncbi:MAG: hypothetical protein P4N60_11180 [Verrucomicrobiae bacterium]|nr:hypothetical protein [Verrucomicrobiae bacterium]